MERDGRGHRCKQAAMFVQSTSRPVRPPPQRARRSSAFTDADVPRATDKLVHPASFTRWRMRDGPDGNVVLKDGQTSRNSARLLEQMGRGTAPAAPAVFSGKRWPSPPPPPALGTGKLCVPPLIDSLLRAQPRSADILKLLQLTAPLVRPARLRIVLAGKPASGKGTQAPLIARRFGMVHISTGNLLRSEIRLGSELGRAVEATMRRGELVPDELILSVLKKRMMQADCRQCGYILDGFPRTLEQAIAMDEAGIAVDHFLVLERSDAEALWWARQRVTDPETSVIYHPIFNPPPPQRDLLMRLERRFDDEQEVVRVRLEHFHGEAQRIFARYADRLTRIDTSTRRTPLEIFADVSATLERLLPFTEDERAVYELPPVPFNNGSLPQRRQHHNNNNNGGGGGRPRPGALRRLVQRFTQQFDARPYLPFYGSQRPDAPRIGFIGRCLAAELLSIDATRAMFDVQLESCDVSGDEGAGDTGFVRLRDGVDSEALAVAAEAMRQHGLVIGWRNERMPLPLGDGRMLEIERACVPYLGLESLGTHVNGYFYRDRGDGPELYVWIARRSPVKPTYPGRLDQLAAGAVPAGTPSLAANVARELQEEASYADAAAARPCSCVRYRYETRKGLCTETLFVYDLQLPEHWTPHVLDGEVSEFYAVPASEALASLTDTPGCWKPNSALVMLDFLMRHGVVNGDNEPDYAEIRRGLVL
ncbi:hypothetical protein CDCA_CDCA02G0616 [Cyanidium caldarium]|uniref:Nudix hydrolase domain-containing protein n=1 Tax=Cyanidium caldarium TaxID=2771 RepID=A0AAV9IQW5_CYACA|nr:hypothetical protein CDCA_CDCA02G0616 [Cyanidium caldarium]